MKGHLSMVKVCVLVGVIQEVQGFISQTVDLVNTSPTVDEHVELEILKKEWNHTGPDLEFNVQKPNLQILQTVCVIYVSYKPLFS